MKHMKKLFLATCIMLLVFGLSGMAAAELIPGELITNGSFENGSFFQEPGTSADYDTLLDDVGSSITGWTVGGDSIDWIRSYWNASAGDYSLDLSGNGPGSISQTFSTIAGNNYYVTFDLAGNPDSSFEKVLGVSAWDASNQIAANTYTFTYDGQTLDNMGWTGENFGFVGTGNEVTLTFASLTGGPWGPAIDNVSMTDPPPPAVPEPATMLLLGTGLIGLTAIGRKNFLRKRS